MLRSSAAADGGRCPAASSCSSAVSALRSSAAADGGRCRRCGSSPAATASLRSSAAADGGRCPIRLGELSPVGYVAILGRRGRRPLPTAARSAARRGGSCDPRPPRTAAAAMGEPTRSRASSVLRSSAAADGGRCCSRTLPSSADPRVAILGRRGRRPLRGSPAAAGSRPPCCDPRPPQTAAAASTHADHRSGLTTLRSSAAADGGRCLETFGLALVLVLVAILGRRGRRPLPCSGSSDPSGPACCDPRPPRTAAAARAISVPVIAWRNVLRSSAAADGGRCSIAPLVSGLNRRLRSSAAADGGRCRAGTAPPQQP